MFKTTHNLPFLQANETLTGNPYFKIGTCHGQYMCDEEGNYCVINIINEEKGNGHFEDFLEWFSQSAKRDGKKLRIVELWNKDLKKHLIEKRGFVEDEHGDVYKQF